MNDVVIELAGAQLTLTGSGSLYWTEEALLCVSDLHLGKSERIARRSGTMLPPYECEDTLARLEAELHTTDARTVVCLGDSFDDRRAAEALSENVRLWIARLQAGRRWIWIEGNHDPGPMDLGGTHLGELSIGPLVFRHIAQDSATGEISGHYHPKAGLIARGRKVSRRCFMWDAERLVMPAYGTYTGGLLWTDPALSRLFPGGAQAALLGDTVRAVPVPRAGAVSV
ncbi:MAG: ligase-associated DNA damage response endonuclease PdeM [Pseudomonadota bacterium]